jgi:2-keto-3-deoxy-6-phosphogluconate aldolase
MEFDQQKGHNNATINFAGLGPEVVEVFVTLSAWGTAMLDDIQQPYVQLKEPNTGGVKLTAVLRNFLACRRYAHTCIAGCPPLGGM